MIMLTRKNKRRIQVNNAQSKGITCNSNETQFITTDAKNLPSHTYRYI